MKSNPPIISMHANMDKMFDVLILENNKSQQILIKLVLLTKGDSMYQYFSTLIIDLN